MYFILPYARLHFHERVVFLLRPQPENLMFTLVIEKEYGAMKDRLRSIDNLL